MALNKKRNASISTNSDVKASKEKASKEKVTKEKVTKEKSEEKSPDIESLQKTLALIVQLLNELDGRVKALEAKVSTIEESINDDDDDDDDDDDEVTADDIDCDKTYKQLRSLSVEDQKSVLNAAMKSLGQKGITAAKVKNDKNYAYAVAEVMCEKHGFETEDFTK